MEDTIIIYTSSEHLNFVLVLAEFFHKQHPSLPITIISTAPDLAAASITSLPSITYHRLSIVEIPSNFTTNPADIHFEIACLYNPILKQFLQKLSLEKNIKALVLDFFCNPAFEVSTSLNIPTYFYDISGGFSSCLFLYLPTIDETIPQDIGDLNDYLHIPGCPPIHSLDIPKGLHFRHTNSYQHFLHTARNMRKSSGILAHTFLALEHRAKEALSNGLCVPNAHTPPVFFIAPLVSKKNIIMNEHECLAWLNAQPSKSVIFLCFGRRGMFSKQQLREIATGLENSGYRFLWSVRNPPGYVNEELDLDALLPTGFMERTKDKGLVLKTWAPQEEILSHDSVGGFVTHCGRRSILEALSFGVPMISFPIYAEQRMNKVFMVEEMKVSLPLEEEAGGLVTAGEMEKRVRELMESNRGKAIRQRVLEFKASAEAAVKKGGSSVVHLENFVNIVFA